MDKSYVVVSQDYDKFSHEKRYAKVHGATRAAFAVWIDVKVESAEFTMLASPFVKVYPRKVLWCPRELFTRFAVCFGTVQQVYDKH